MEFKFQRITYLNQIATPANWVVEQQVRNFIATDTTNTYAYVITYFGTPTGVSGAKIIIYLPDYANQKLIKQWEGTVPVGKRVVDVVPECTCGTDTIANVEPRQSQALHYYAPGYYATGYYV